MGALAASLVVIILVTLTHSLAHSINKYIKRFEYEKKKKKNDDSTNKKSDLYCTEHST